MRLNPAVSGTFAPPVMEARRWLDGVSFPPERPLLNLSQAAPVEPPPEPLRRAMAEAVLSEPGIHLYGPVLGNPDVREALAARTSAIYGGAVSTAQVAITQGCNQAFCAALAALAGPGDAVILPTPWYFNHKMWLDMASVEAVPLPTGPGLLPDPEEAGALITDRTRAIVLVTPNNPGGVEYPPALIASFRDLARTRGIALVVDETYRDFHGTSGAPHALFEDPDWDDALVHLYSFSKAFRLTGHRVGALVASPRLLAEVEKVLDTVAICPSQIGQHAALWGLRNLGQWLSAERDTILARRRAMEAALLSLDGWRLLGCGAYFAYAEHPFALPSPEFSRRLVRDAGILILPGTMFMPEGEAAAERQVRIAFANADEIGIAELARRLGGLGFPRH